MYLRMPIYYTFVYLKLLIYLFRLSSSGSAEQGGGGLDGLQPPNILTKIMFLRSTKVKLSINIYKTSANIVDNALELFFS